MGPFKWHSVLLSVTLFSAMIIRIIRNHWCQSDNMASFQTWLLFPKLFLERIFPAYMSRTIQQSTLWCENSWANAKIVHSRLWFQTPAMTVGGTLHWTSITMYVVGSGDDANILEGIELFAADVNIHWLQNMELNYDEICECKCCQGESKTFIFPTEVIPW